MFISLSHLYTIKTERPFDKDSFRFPLTGPSYPSPLKCKCPRIQGKLALSPSWVFFRTGLWSVWGFLNPLSLEFWLLRKLRT